MGPTAELSDPTVQGKARKGEVDKLDFRNKPTLIGPALKVHIRTKQLETTQPARWWGEGAGG